MEPLRGGPGRGSLFPNLRLPFVLGFDVAGVVVSTGSPASESRFKPGDRVVGMPSGSIRVPSDPTEAAFHNYCRLREGLAAHLPSSIGFEEGVVIPAGLCTATAALFQDENLGLLPPTSPRRDPVGQTVLIWGGASSVGSNAIQLAVAAGYEVVTTASPVNFEYVKALGAKWAFDYRSATVEEDILHMLGEEGRCTAGAFAIPNGSLEPCVRILGDKRVSVTAGRRFVSSAMPVPAGLDTGEVGAEFCNCTTVEEKGYGVLQEFLPKALDAAEFLPRPAPQVVGTELECIQGALETMAKGVKATKLVVSIPAE